MRARRRRAAARWLPLLLALQLACLAAATPVTADPGPIDEGVRDHLDEHGPLQVGWPGRAVPLVVVEDDVVTGGWAVELWELMALSTGIEIEHVVLPSARDLPDALRDGLVDIVGAAGTNPALLDIAEPSAPLGHPSLVLAVADESPARTVADLDGTTVLTLPGPTVRRLADVADRPYDVVVADSIDDAVDRVLAGEAAAYLGPLDTVGYQLRQRGRELRPIGDPVAEIEVRSWALADTPAAAAMHAARSSLTDVEAATVQVRWTGFDLSLPASERRGPAWLDELLLAAFAGMAVLGLFVQLLRRRVRAATTELRELNEDLEQRVADRTSALELSNRALDRTNATLRRFSERVAHDLRGPLTAIIGWSETLQVTGDLGARERQASEIVLRSAVRLDGMIETLLDEAVSDGMSLPRWTGPELELWLVDVVEPEIRDRGVRLSVDVPDAEVDAAPDVLRHAVLNLVGNALKHAAGETPTVDVELRRHGATWVLTVDDDGVGIPPARRADVLRRGVRLDVDRPGRGFGLAAVRVSVEEAGGRVEIGDAPLGGARVRVVLPVDGTDGDVPESEDVVRT